MKRNPMFAMLLACFTPLMMAETGGGNDEKTPSKAEIDALRRKQEYEELELKRRALHGTNSFMDNAKEIGKMVFTNLGSALIVAGGVAALGFVGGWSVEKGRRVAQGDARVRADVGFEGGNNQGNQGGASNDDNREGMSREEAGRRGGEASGGGGRGRQRAA